MWRIFVDSVAMKPLVPIPSFTKSLRSCNFNIAQLRNSWMHVVLALTRIAHDLANSWATCAQNCRVAWLDLRSSIRKRALHNHLCASTHDPDICMIRCKGIFKYADLSFLVVRHERKSNVMPGVFFRFAACWKRVLN